MSRLAAMAGFMLFAASLQAGACSSDRRCSPTDPDWPPMPGSMLPDSHELNIEIRVGARGRIVWSHGTARPISLAELREALAIVQDFNPQPWLIIRAERDADCETVEAVRDALDRLAMCAEGRCVAGEAWDRRFGRTSPAS